MKLAGLVCDSAGAIFLAAGLIVTRARALELGVSRMGGTDEENLQLPFVREMLQQSRRSKQGGFLLLLGFVLQIIGNWP